MRLAKAKFPGNQDVPLDNIIYCVIIALLHNDCAAAGLRPKAPQCRENQPAELQDYKHAAKKQRRSCDLRYRLAAAGLF